MQACSSLQVAYLKSRLVPLSSGVINNALSIGLLSLTLVLFLTILCPYQSKDLGFPYFKRYIATQVVLQVDYFRSQDTLYRSTLSLTIPQFHSPKQLHPLQASRIQFTSASHSVHTYLLSF
ncbi:hypothetical protein FGO68_gene8482 [Halteria grandinella]|uniref:Uncharacterized protein n=1 Tax=Halteria grandinella TaxID=5974 RepID=A0A8J8SZ53_HALGN|nr:hypothetical protein FGO68_gene8482 [Halteria grandinella]